MCIPDGYVLVPKEWADKYFAAYGWLNIDEPTIKEAAEYVRVSTEKIKKDLRNIDCPLRKTNNGSMGRGNQMKFLKSSVEEYKKWISY